MDYIFCSTDTDTDTDIDICKALINIPYNFAYYRD